MNEESGTKPTPAVPEATRAPTAPTPASPTVTPNLTPTRHEQHGRYPTAATVADFERNLAQVRARIDAACGREKPKALYLNPTLHNPLTLTVPEARRRQIADVARRHGAHSAYRAAS